MDQVRTFIALELPPGAREALRRVSTQLQATAPSGVRWVRPESVHLTLKFLGSTPTGLVESVSRALARCAASIAPFDLSLEGLGAFPNLRAPRVIWMGLSGSLEPLLDLQSAVDGELEGLGFARETRSFSPHLTLGRIRQGTPPPLQRGIGDAIANATVEVTGGMHLEEVSLIRSDLTPSGALYTLLFSVPFSGTT